MIIHRILRTLLLPVFRRSIASLEGLEHLPKHGGFLIAANHIDYLDGFFLTTAIAMHQPRLVKFLSETKNYWWTGGATIPIDRTNKAESLHRALNALKKQKVVCIFPEGQRNEKGVLLQGKTGVARLALRAQVPVFPVGLVGPSGKSFTDSVRKYIVHGEKLRIAMGPALMFPHQPVANSSEFTREELNHATRAIMQAIGTLAHKSFTP